MKRQELEELGLTKEQIDKVIKINGLDIENAKSVASNDYNSIKAEYESLKEQVKERDKQIENLKSSAGDNEELKKQIESLQEQNKLSQDEHIRAITQLKIDTAVDKALTNAKARNTKAARALLDLKDAKLDENGLVVGLKEKIDALMKADDSKFLFESNGQSSLKGVKPSEKSDDNLGTTNDFKKMSYNELVKFLNDNPGAKLE